MKTLKRVKELHLLIAFVVLLLLLAACGGAVPEPAESDTSSTSSETTSTEATDQEPEEEAVVEQAEEEESVVEEEVAAEEETAAESESEEATDAKWASRPFTYAGETYPTQIDPGMAVDFPGTQANHPVYEPLIQYEFGTLDLKPMLATEWGISDDGLEYRFKLREGVTFHDGSEFDAEDVKFAYERIKDGEMGMATFLVSFDHAEVDSSHEVRLVLSQPDANFIWTIPMVRIVSTSALDHEVDGDLGLDYLSNNMIGTGPYMIDRLDPPNNIFYTAYQDYWGGWDGPHFKEAVFRWGLDFSTKLLQFEEGTLDLMPDVNPDDAERLSADPNLVIVQGPVPRAAFYSMNTKNGPLSDIRVRRAVQLAFPYQDMPEVFPNFAEVLTGALPPGLADHDPSGFQKWEQDLDAARELLNEAGYSEGDLSLTIGVISDFTIETLPAQLLKESLAEVGVELNIETVPWATLSTAMSSLDTSYDMGALLMTAKTPYAGNYLHQYGHSSAAGGNWNWSYYENPDFDALLEQAAASPDPEERTELLTEAHQILVDDAVHLWEFSSSSLMGHQSNLKGYVYPTWSWARVVDVYDFWLEE